MRRYRNELLVLAQAMLAQLLSCSSRAVTHLKRQDPAPGIALKDGKGNEVASAQLKGRVVVVIFGELYHERTRQACDQIGAALKDQRLDGVEVVPVLIVTREAKAEEPGNAKANWLPPAILTDPQRKAFEAYRVMAMPSVVVIDKEGRVVHATAGAAAGLGDLVTDSVLLAVGKLSVENFDKSRNGQASAPASEEEIRAERLTQLARQLARRGLKEMAVEKYAEALKLSPNHAVAHLEYGSLLLGRRRLSEAESHFRAALAANPQALEAVLGIAFVQALRGGEELGEAERSVRSILAKSPAQPRAWYLLGLIQEQKKKPEEAAVSFKKAAQLLLEGVGEEAGDERR